jgi:hypothetical protein
MLRAPNKPFQRIAAKDAAPAEWRRQNSESMSAVISGLIGGAIAVALTTYVARRVGKAAVPGQLRFGMFMWILGVGCLGLSLLPIVITQLGNDRDLWAKVALFIGFGLGAVYCFGEAAFVRGNFDAEGISFSTPWTGLKSEKWKDLESVELNDWASWYTLTFKSGSKIRLSRYLSGHLSALEMVETVHEF